ncbi:unnamed protein product, partial [Ectocarpus sp. 4 AP-2014]
MEIDDKNVAQGTLMETNLEDGFRILRFQNESNGIQKVIREIDSSLIQFHFCLKGDCTFNFNNGRYTLDLKEEHSLLLYNPQRNLPINLDVHPKSWLVSVIISIKKFHSLFSME